MIFYEFRGCPWISIKILRFPAEIRACFAVLTNTQCMLHSGKTRMVPEIRGFPRMLRCPLSPQTGRNTLVHLGKKMWCSGNCISVRRNSKQTGQFISNSVLSPVRGHSQVSISSAIGQIRGFLRTPAELFRNTVRSV